VGLFSFLRNKGQKLTSSREDAPPPGATLSDAELADLTFQNRLVRFVREMGMPVEGLRIEFRNGKATLHGKAETQGNRENIVIAIGNTEGVETVDDRMTVKEQAPQSLFYTVKAGDTLGKIAKDHYGKASKYPLIFEANRPMLSDPDKIYPGQVLRIPQDEG